MLVHLPGVHSADRPPRGRHRRIRPPAGVAARVVDLGSGKGDGPTPADRLRRRLGNLTLPTLALALADAGVVRAMEFDIHSALVSFASWTPSLTGHVAPTTLLPGMDRPAGRYLSADQRDFFYLTLR
jgi:hypothetical protein